MFLRTVRWGCGRSSRTSSLRPFQGTSFVLLIPKKTARPVFPADRLNVVALAAAIAPQLPLPIRDLMMISPCAFLFSPGISSVRFWISIFICFSCVPAAPFLNAGRHFFHCYYYNRVLRILIPLFFKIWLLSRFTSRPNCTRKGSPKKPFESSPSFPSIFLSGNASRSLSPELECQHECDPAAREPRSQPDTRI